MDYFHEASKENDPVRAAYAQMNEADKSYSKCDTSDLKDKLSSYMKVMKKADTSEEDKAQIKQNVAEIQKELNKRQ